ncbi:MAG: DUF3592 domain-containing protein [Spirochaetes bacterium]|nr:DUF3592 domain-containing protein [Spirochaetota bacterium]
MSFIPYVFGAFMCVVGAGLGFGGFQSRKKSKTAAAWPTVPGTITSAEVETHRSSGMSSKGHSTTRVSYEPVVKYSYSVEGKEFKGKNIGLTTVSTGKGAAEKRIEALTSNPKLKVYYNPNDPKEACLDPKAGGSIGMFVIGAALLLLGIVVLANATMLVEIFSF